MNRPHYSYSQLSQYLRCPLQYYFERIARLPRPFVSSSLVLGGAVHEALAVYHTAIMERLTVATHTIGDVFFKAWGRRAEQQPIQLRPSETSSTLIDQGVALLEAYLAEPPPENIVAVEQTLIVPLETSAAEYLDRPLVTVVDVLCRDVDGSKVIELKTSGRRFSQTDVDSSLQASCYVGAVTEYFGQPVDLEYRVLVKTKTPQVQRISRSVGDVNLTRVANLAHAVDRAVSAEAFFPNENPINCSSCPYRQPCREWQGTRSETTESDRSTSEVEVAAC